MKFVVVARLGWQHAERPGNKGKHLQQAGSPLHYYTYLTQDKQLEEPLCSSANRAVGVPEASASAAE